MAAMASQITSLTFVDSTVYSSADQRKHQRSASLAFVRGIHRGPVNSPHKGPVTRKVFPFGDVIMNFCLASVLYLFTIAFILRRIVFTNIMMSNVIYHKYSYASKQILYKKNVYQSQQICALIQSSWKIKNEIFMHTLTFSSDIEVFARQWLFPAASSVHTNAIHTLVTRLTYQF